MGWGHACWHASAYIVLVGDRGSCHACGRGFEQQEELGAASLTEWKSRSFAVCLLFCAVIMVIKERKTLMRHI